MKSQEELREKLQEAQVREAKQARRLRKEMKTLRQVAVLKKALKKTGSSG